MVPPPTSAPAPPRPPARDEASDLVHGLFEAHAQQVLRFLRRRDADLAEDALSETFAVAVRRAADIPEGKELPWLYVVAEHVLRNLQRSRRRAARIPEALQPFARHSTEQPDAPYVGEALGELPDRERILLTMTAFEGLSAHEAADLMGIPYGSARNALSSGRKRLAVVLAAAAALVLVVGMIVAAVDAIRSQRGQSLQTLASAISGASVVHDVAIVRHDDPTAGAGGPGTAERGTGAAARYERWSDRTGDRTRVRLPGGAEVVAGGGETLQSAANEVTASTPPARRRAVKADLGVLDAASPAAIAALLADPAAQRTATDGPRIAGRDTTTLRGRIADASGVERAVRVFVARDEPTVLRVRVREIERAGSGAAAGRASDEASTVDFVSWAAEPGPDEAAARPQPATASGGLPDTASVVAAAEADRPLTGDQTPTATASNSPDSDRAPGVEAANRVPRGGSEPPSAAATGPVLHAHQTVQLCSSGGGTAMSCQNYGDREIWVELTGERRSRVRSRRPNGGPVRGEDWTTPTGSRSYSLSRDGQRAYGAIREFDGAQTRAPLPTEYFGGWQAALAPTIAELQGRPEALAALPAGPDVAGRATRVRTLVLPGGHPRAPTVEIVLDAARAQPLTISLHHDATGTDGSPTRQSIILSISAWEQLPPGDHAALLTSRIPEGARITHE